MTNIKITLSDTRPVSINPDTWPVIAAACAHDGKVQCQANTEWSIRVREHSDGRRLIYSIKTAGNGGQYAGFRDARGGFLLESRAVWEQSKIEVETIRAIRRAAGIIERPDLADECTRSHRGRVKARIRVRHSDGPLWELNKPNEHSRQPNASSGVLQSH